MVIGVGILVDADRKDDQARLVAMELEEGWKLDDAGLAPCGPEVDQHRMAAITGQVNRAFAVGDREVGGDLSGLRRVSAAIAGRDRGQRKQKQ